MRAGVGVVLAAFAGACDPSVLGEPCHLLRADGTEVLPRPGHDLVQSGSGECPEFLCASFAGAPPTCTAACTEEGATCADGWVCRAAILSRGTLVEADRRAHGTDQDGDGVDDATELTAALTESLYCAKAP